jgi:glycerophosphoryl diester phosphodiesterase
MSRVVQRAADAPLVIGHRGACGYLPEHTLASYRMAIGMGVDFIEPDLVLTKDQRLIARHDNELSLTTDVARRREFVHRFTTKLVDGVQRKGWFCEDFELSEIKALRVLDSYPDRHGSLEMDEAELRIPSIEEVIALVREEEARSGSRIGIYPETKIPTYYARNGCYLDGSPIHQSIGRLLIEALLREGFSAPDRVFIQSFEIANLIELHERIMPSNGLTLPLIQLFGDIEGGMVLPEGDFSMPYDLRYHHQRGDDLGSYYGNLAEIAEVVSRRSYRSLLCKEAIEWMAGHYASGIGLWIGNLLPKSPLGGLDVGASALTGRNGAADHGTMSALIRFARKRGMHLHAYPLCLMAPSPQSSGIAWRDREIEEALQLFNQGVNGLFCNLPDIGVEAKRRFLAGGDRSE